MKKQNYILETCPGCKVELCTTAQCLILCMNNVTGKKFRNVSFAFMTPSHRDIFHYFLLENPELLSYNLLTLKKKKNY